jgi:hypothetical protein
MCYDLTDGRMDGIQVTDDTVAEQMSLFPIEPGAIYMADAGLGKGTQFLHIVENKADALLRATPSNLCLAEDERGRIKINMAEKLSTSANLLDFECFLHTKNGQYTAVRIIASRLPEDKAQAAKKRKKRNASKKQYKISNETLIYAEWVVLITSLPKEYTAEHLLKMYRARWQIELLFKRIKQALKIVKLRPASLEHSKACVLMMLFLWALTEKQVLAAEWLLLQKGTEMVRYSAWSTSRFMFQRLQDALAAIRVAITPKSDVVTLLRLFHHRSSRSYQYNELRFGEESC